MSQGSPYYKLVHNRKNESKLVKGKIKEETMWLTNFLGKMSENRGVTKCGVKSGLKRLVEKNCVKKRC